MKTDSRMILLLATLFLAACTSAIPAISDRGDVPILGTLEERAGLAGTWAGQVTFPDPLINGSVAFRIEAGSDRAAGRLISTSEVPPPPFLYLRLDGSRLRGTAEVRYEDACRCSVHTTFDGQHDGDVISGEIRRVEDRSRVVVGRLQVSRLNPSSRP